jgi:hypothetical protein
MKRKLGYTFFVILASVTAFARTKPLPKTNAELTKTDTLHVMVSVKNHFYYYENSMLIDGSDFMLTNPRGIKERIMMFLYESKNKNHQSLILLKIQEKAALNKDSKSVIKYIRQQNYKHVDLKTVERELINATEKS